MLLQNLYTLFTTDGAFPQVEDASSIGANAPLYQYQKCRLLEMSTDNKLGGPSPL